MKGRVIIGHYEPKAPVCVFRAKTSMMWISIILSIHPLKMLISLWCFSVMFLA